MALFALTRTYGSVSVKENKVQTLHRVCLPVYIIWMVDERPPIAVTIHVWRQSLSSFRSHLYKVEAALVRTKSNKLRIRPTSIFLGFPLAADMALFGHGYLWDSLYSFYRDVPPISWDGPLAVYSNHLVCAFFVSWALFLDHSDVSLGSLSLACISNACVLFHSIIECFPSVFLGR
jgi:hypothetical protein